MASLHDRDTALASRHSRRQLLRERQNSRSDHAPFRQGAQCTPKAFAAAARPLRDEIEPGRLRVGPCLVSDHRDGVLDALVLLLLPRSPQSLRADDRG